MLIKLFIYCNVIIYLFILYHFRRFQEVTFVQPNYEIADIIVGA